MPVVAGLNRSDGIEVGLREDSTVVFLWARTVTSEMKGFARL